MIGKDNYYVGLQSPHYVTAFAIAEVDNVLLGFIEISIVKCLGVILIYPLSQSHKRRHCIVNIL